MAILVTFIIILVCITTLNVSYRTNFLIYFHILLHISNLNLSYDNNL